MLAGAGAVHRNGAGDHAGLERLGAVDLLRFGGIDQDQHVEIAVADMADDRSGEAVLVGIAAGVGQAFGEPRDRHADIGDHGARAGPQTKTGIERVVAGMPEPAAVFRRLGPFEAAAAMLCGDRLRRSACSATAVSEPWNSKNSVGASR